MVDGERAPAERLLARCRTIGLRVVLYQGRIFAGYPAGDEGVFGWRPAPTKIRRDIDRCEADIRTILADSGSSRPWAIEQLDGGALLYFAPFGAGGRHRRPRAPEGDAA